MYVDLGLVFKWLTGNPILFQFSEDYQEPENTKGKTDLDDRNWACLLGWKCKHGAYVLLARF